MEITGTLTEKFDAVQVSATFKKRAFVIECVEKDREKFPELISLEFIQDKCDLIEKYLIGDKVTVLFNLKGRKWVSPSGEIKYFNTLQAWKIHSEKDENSYNKSPDFNQEQPEQPKPVAEPSKIEPPAFNSEPADDIPF